ncbi:caspase-8-like, partial [Stegodyphus dumicola]|uniref:caspase-8-like n=1 Tax=Stegodyphus dumicola TaxID=202533 RepID=UPI0015AFDC34
KHDVNFLQEFKDKSLNRNGSNLDAKRLKHDFESLGFVVTEHSNLNKKDTKEILKAVSKIDHSRKKYFVCCILSHGDIGTIKAYDEEIKVKSLLKPFHSKLCSLWGKPKIFIIQIIKNSTKSKPTNFVLRLLSQESSMRLSSSCEVWWSLSMKRILDPRIFFHIFFRKVFCKPFSELRKVFNEKRQQFLRDSELVRGRVFMQVRETILTAILINFLNHYCSFLLNTAIYLLATAVDSPSACA